MSPNIQMLGFFALANDLSRKETILTCMVNYFLLYSPTLSMLPSLDDLQW